VTQVKSPDKLTNTVQREVPLGRPALPQGRFYCEVDKTKLSPAKVCVAHAIKTLYGENDKVLVRLCRFHWCQFRGKVSEMREKEKNRNGDTLG
jgi:hypothetical protein